MFLHLTQRNSSQFSIISLHMHPLSIPPWIPGPNTHWEKKYRDGSTIHLWSQKKKTSTIRCTLNPHGLNPERSKSGFVKHYWNYIWSLKDEEIQYIKSDFYSCGLLCQITDFLWQQKERKGKWNIKFPFKSDNQKKNLLISAFSKTEFYFTICFCHIKWNKGTDL